MNQLGGVGGLKHDMLYLLVIIKGVQSTQWIQKTWSFFFYFFHEPIAPCMSVPLKIILNIYFFHYVKF